MKLEIQLFGGRGASSSGEKGTARYKLQQAIYKANVNDNTRVVMQNAYGGNLFDAKITQINSAKYVEDLRRPASSVSYDAKTNTLLIKLKKEKNVKQIPF